MSRHLIYACLLGVLFASQGCYHTRLLRENEQILVGQTITVSRQFNKEDLEGLYQQEASKSFLYVLPPPNISFYVWGEKNYDKAAYEEKLRDAVQTYDQKIADTTQSARKIRRLQERKATKVRKLRRGIENGNLLMRIGEPLAIYQPNATKKTEEGLKRYFFLQGYFNAKVTTTVKTRKRKTRVQYVIDTQKPHYIDSLSYRIEDKDLHQIVLAHAGESLLQKGTPYAQNLLIRERRRVYEHIADKGYYTFTEQDIHFLVDTTTRQEKGVWIALRIASPSRYERYKTYRVDSVTFTVLSEHESLPTGTSFHEAGFGYNTKQYKPSLLRRRSQLRPGQFYSYSREEGTKQWLGDTNVFTLVDVRHDTLGTHLHSHIILKPVKKYVFSYDVGTEISQALPSPFVELDVRASNLLHLLDIIQPSFRFTLGGLPTPLGKRAGYQSYEYAGGLSFLYPHFLLPYGHGLSTRIGAYGTRTSIALQVEADDRQDYVRTRFNTSYTLHWKRSKETSYSLSLLDINFINSRTSTDFASELNTFFNAFSSSFDPSFVSSVHLTRTYNKGYYGNYGWFSTKEGHYFQLILEAGGLFHALYADSFERLGLKTYQYSRFYGEYKQLIPLGYQNNLAWRIKTGASIRHQKDSSLPYEKYFFVGGSTSVRGWQPRRLGPGSYRKPSILPDIERPGEILLEMNIEWRAKISNFVHGAMFIDGGNVWYAQEALSLEGSAFKIHDFWKEVAFSVGFGIRFNFSIFLFRLDAGIKAYDAAQKEGERFVLHKFRLPHLLGSGDEQALWNIGIGYPF